MKIQPINNCYPKRSMLIRYWQPFQEIEAMRRQFDRMFGEVSPRSSEASNVEAAEAVWTPAIELQDTGEAFMLRAQLPGLVAKNIDIQVGKEAIAISGQRHPSELADSTRLRSEFRYGKFQRIVRLPAAVQNDQVQAEYKDGILHLTLPKMPEVRHQVVKINLGSSVEAADRDMATNDE